MQAPDPVELVINGIAAMFGKDSAAISRSNTPLINTQKIDWVAHMPPEQLQQCCDFMWPLGQLTLACGPAVLVLGYSCDRREILASVFCCEQQSWTRPVPVLSIGGHFDEIKCGATAGGTNRFALYTRDDHAASYISVFSIDLDPLAVCTAVTQIVSEESHRHIALSHDGQLLTLVTERGTRGDLYSIDDESLLVYEETIDCRDSCITMMGFTADGKHVGVVSAKTNLLTLFALSDDPDVRVFGYKKGQTRIIMPTDADVLARFARTAKATSMLPLSEPAMILCMETARRYALATQHHLSVSGGGIGRHCFVADDAGAVAVLLRDDFYAYMDDSAAVVIGHYDGNTSHVIQPYPRKMAEQAFSVRACACDACENRCSYVSERLCHPALVLSADGAALFVVDQWGMARTLRGGNTEQEAGGGQHMANA